LIAEFTDLIASSVSLIEKGGYQCFKYTKITDLSLPGSYR